MIVSLVLQRGVSPGIGFLEGFLTELKENKISKQLLFRVFTKKTSFETKLRNQNKAQNRLKTASKTAS